MKHFNTHQPGRNSGYAEKPPRPAVDRSVNKGGSDAPSKPAPLDKRDARSGESQEDSAQDTDSKG